MRQQVQPDRNTSWRPGRVQPYWPSEARIQTQFHAALLKKTLTSTVSLSLCLSLSPPLLPLPDNFCIFGERSFVLWDILTNLWCSMFSLCSTQAHLLLEMRPLQKMTNSQTPICALRAKLAQPSGKAGPECYSTYVLFLLHQFISITEITLTHYCVMKTESRATNAQSTPDCPNITQSPSLQ